MRSSIPLVMVNIIVFLALSSALVFVMIHTDDFKAQLQTTLSYTDKTEAKCVDITKSVDGSYYTMTYMYESPESDTPYYISYIEYDVEPDISELWVSSVDPTKVSKTPVTALTKIAYIVNQPLFILIEFVLLFSCILACCACIVRNVARRTKNML